MERNASLMQRLQIAPLIGDVRTSVVACGIGNVLGNKGGVAVSFRLGGAPHKSLPWLGRLAEGASATAAGGPKSAGEGASCPAASSLAATGGDRGVRIALVTSHLAAHDQHVLRRNADYTRLLLGFFAAGGTGTGAGTGSNDGQPCPPTPSPCSSPVPQAGQCAWPKH
jgi:hypothetical protein